MGVILAVANQKGGVAKTTSAHNIAAALHKLGNSVLLVDLDSQASLTISVGLEPLEIENTIVTALDEGESITNCIQKLQPRLDIVTSIIDLANTELLLFRRYMDRGKKKWAQLLKEVLEPIRAQYDYILIDCPPQLSVLTINALSCADWALIPSKTDYLSYRGLTQLADTIDALQRLSNPSLKTMGVIATLYESRARDDNDILAALREEYDVLGVVKKLVVAKMGIYDGLSVVERNPGSEIAREYMRIARTIIEKSKEA